MIAAVTPQQPPTRLRKAWAVSLRGWDGGPTTYYAPSRSKARYQALMSIENDDVGFADITVRRAPWHDVQLPPRSPIADELTDKQQHCLLHAYGATCGDVTRAGFRDHYYTSANDADLCRLVELGLMTKDEKPQYGKGMAYFLLTKLGRHVCQSLIPEYN